MFKSSSPLIFIIILLLYSCAQQVSPTGGGFDRIPPKLKYANPKDSSTNFTGRQIEFEFDEFVQLKDINNQLIISPSLSKFPEVITKGKKITIKLKEDLKPNTTYQLNFGYAIADITESSIAENFRYVFSTGPQLDSLMIEGIVEHASEIKTEKGILVGLYDDLSDTAIFKTIPTYIAKTKENGSFRIQNIKEGIYNIYAFKDLNGNLMLDPETEPVAFNDKKIELPKDSDYLKMKLFLNNPSKQFVKKSNALAIGKVRIILNVPVQKPVLHSIDSVKFNYTITSRLPGDTLDIYYDRIDAEYTNIVLSDSSGVIDTLEIKLLTKKSKNTGRGKGGFLLYANDNLNGTKKLELNQNLELTFNNPVIKADTSKLRIRNITKNENVKFKVMKSDPLKFRFDFIPEESTDYSFVAFPGAFTDMYDLKNDTIKSEFKTEAKDAYGNLKIKITADQSYKGNYIALLNNEKGIAVAKKYLRDLPAKSQVLQFEYLIPGNYDLRLVEDSNNNQKWDTGNLSENKQPERIIYYSGKINVRANWDLEQDWELK